MEAVNLWGAEKCAKVANPVARSFQLCRIQGRKRILIADMELPRQASGNLFNPIIEKSELDERVKRNIEMQTEKLKASSVQLEELLGEQNLGKNQRESESSRSGALNLQDLPHPSSKFCAVCNEKFTNYYQHILEPTHISNFSNDSRTAHLHDFIFRQCLVGFTEKDNVRDVVWDDLSRRPSLEEYKAQENDKKLDVPQKRRKTMRENENVASSTNIFQCSVSENPVSIKGS